MERKDRQIDKKCVFCPELRLFVLCVESLCEFSVGSLEIKDQILRPGGDEILSEQGGKPCVAAFLAEVKAENTGDVEEIKEFIIDPVFFAVSLFRENTGHLGVDRVSAEILHDGDALVPLLDVELIHVFIRFDRIPQAFTDLIVVEIGPF